MANRRRLDKAQREAAEQRTAHRREILVQADAECAEAGLLVEELIPHGQNECPGTRFTLPDGSTHSIPAKAAPGSFFEIPAPFYESGAGILWPCETCEARPLLVSALPLYVGLASEQDLLRYGGVDPAVLSYREGRLLLGGILADWDPARIAIALGELEDRNLASRRPAQSGLVTGTWFGGASTPAAWASLTLSSSQSGPRSVRAVTSSSSSLVSPYANTPVSLSRLPTTAGCRETLPRASKLASARVLHRNGREVIEVLIFRPLLEILSQIQAACLRAGKGARKAKGRGDYHSRSMAGVAGELALHFVARMLGLEARLLLPSLSPQPLDHRVVVDSRELAIQSKTSCLTKSITLNTIYGRFRFVIDTCDDLDYYSFAVVADDELFSQSDYITVHLFALVPIGFVKEHATIDKSFGRHITFEDLQAADQALDYYVLHPEGLLRAELIIDQDTYTSLTSRSIEDRLISALDVIDSSSDASRVLDMLCDEPALFEAFKAMDPIAQETQPISEAPPPQNSYSPEAA